jgi:hypothetical protein
MPDVLVRNLDGKVLEQLRQAARARGRSLQAEIHAALERAGRVSLGETGRISQRWLRRLHREGRTFTDSTALIREDRDAR